MPEGEVVTDIRPLNRLVVFRAYVYSVTTTHEIGWFSRSDQTMLTPAYVDYYVDMATMTQDSVRVRGKKLFIALPALMIERPNVDFSNVLTFNAGLWTNVTGTADRLRIANSRQAMQQLFKRAKMPFLIDAARKSAIAAVTANVQNALATDGHPGLVVRVVS